MILRDTIWSLLAQYDFNRIKLGVLGSHSALDVCDGAVEEGFVTLVVCQEGREQPYTRYFRSHREDNRVTRGCVDETIVLPQFADIIDDELQARLRAENIVFVPNRSFVAYCGIDGVEEFGVPLLGSRNLLRLEDRGAEYDYYQLLEEAGLPFPEAYPSPAAIDRLVMVKVHHKQMPLERGFFTAASEAEYHQKADRLIKQGIITEGSLTNARIERYIIGPVFNLDFFYSPLAEGGEGLELLGIDWRFETSLDGFVRLPSAQQMTLRDGQRDPTYIVCGHNTATLRESLLNKVFPLAERFVEFVAQKFSPGVIGAFCLQTVCDDSLNFYIYDVAPRIGGGTNVHLFVGHPYGNTLYRDRMSSGRRSALELRKAIETDRLKEIVT